MIFRSAFSVEPSTVKRAALYLRVSTGRQAAGDVSIPSRELTRRYCEAQGWVVTESLLSPARRPQTIGALYFNVCLSRLEVPIDVST
jgi:hypothetical protein